MSLEERARWELAHRGAGDLAPPAAFVVEHADLLPAGRVLDLACGRGRNARLLAERGATVVAVDVAAAALASPALVHPRIVRARMDLDAPGFRAAAFDAVVCVSFLDRRLFPAFAEWLRPGGVLLFETYTIEQREIGHPRNPDFLLQPNELVDRLRPAFRVLRYREGPVGEGAGRCHRAGIVATLAPRR